MHEREYAVMAAMERELWWYRSLHARVRAALEKHLRPAGGPPTIVDAGCGTGGTREAVVAGHPGWRYFGVDLSAHALAFCRSGGFTACARGSVDRLPFATAAADAVVSLDVLYFAAIDRPAALREFHRVLRPAGIAVLNLPAFAALRGEHDRAVGVAHRFRRPELRRLLADTGFEWLEGTYWNAALFLPLLCWRVLSRRRARRAPEPRSDLYLPPPRWADAALRGLLRLEAAVSRRVPLPVGSSVFVVARRRD